MHNISPILELPLDSKRPNINKNAGRKETSVIPLDNIQPYKKFLAKHQVSMFIGFLTLFSIILNKWSKKNDFVIGINTQNRDLEQFERTIGDRIQLSIMDQKLDDLPDFQEVHFLKLDQEEREPEDIGPLFCYPAENSWWRPEFQRYFA